MAKKEISYSDAISEIEEIVNIIENGELNVDEISEKIKRVSLLIKSCQKKLHETQVEIEKILEKIDE
ncbi:MAG: exodeoxyribonuclease VII small subunit [Bacteroidales bacterium]|nr:exodeoxyribonuclease VII small subunit [Bacteroidales bacterium]